MAGNYFVKIWPRGIYTMYSILQKLHSKQHEAGVLYLSGMHYLVYAIVQVAARAQR